MKNLIKFLVFASSAALTITLFLLYRQNGSAFFAWAGMLGMFASSITLISFFWEEISAAINSTKQNLRHREVRQENINESPDIEQWDNFIDNHPIPAIIFDDELHIKSRNKTFTELLARYSLDENAGNLCDVFDCNLESFHDAKDRNISVTGDAILKNSNKSPFVFSSFRISESEKLYLAQFVDNSEKTELKEKFIQAQKMQAIGQLAGGIAHDFNNLLTAIIGFSDLLLTKHLPGDASFMDIMHIKQNANRAANLVRQLLAFSRKQTMQMEVLQLNEVLSEITNLIRRLIGEGIALDINFDRNLWDVKADKSQLDQVLINLAVNARDAMRDLKSGSGVLSINCENIEIVSSKDTGFKYYYSAGPEEILPGKYLKISISDNGHGIEPGNLKKIFEPFFTTKEVGQGTGLGLATVTGIVQQTGGFIFVSSEIDKGTEFLIFIRRYEKTLNDVKAIEEKKEKILDLTGSGTVLIVEDEEPVRMFSSRALKNKGYTVLEAFSGENGLEVVEKAGGKIDLIVSDVVMPGISGPEFVEEVQKQYPDIKVIFVSGYGEDAFYQKYGQERKFNFLPKPYTLNQLAERVKEILNN